VHLWIVRLSLYFDFYLRILTSFPQRKLRNIECNLSKSLIMSDIECKSVMAVGKSDNGNYTI
jgi:hypothetical protein